MTTLKQLPKLVAVNGAKMKRFINKIEKNPPKGINSLAKKLEQQVWEQIDCLSCANCCKKMSPTFTKKDIKRIAPALGFTVQGFKDKYLYLDKVGDWMNTKQPCQFLGKDNKCSIYEIRPDDCRLFPHLSRYKVSEFVYIHKQNINYCPASYTMVSKLMEAVK
jgi:uncharacterized protein